MNKILNKTTLILVIIISIFFGLNFVIAPARLGWEENDGKKFTESNYELIPIWDKYFVDIYDIQNAYANIGPDSKLKYAINSYKEKFDIFEGKINYLTLAEKRIVEIEKFGLKDSLLDEYKKNIDLFIKAGKDVSDIKLKKLITNYQKRIDLYIYNLSEPFDTKQKYQKKADQIFNSLLDKYNEKLVQYDPQKLIYSTSDILVKSDFGSYSIYSDEIPNIESLDISGKQYLTPKLLSKIDNKLFQELLNNSSCHSGATDKEAIESNCNNAETLSVTNVPSRVTIIPISANTKIISISYPTINLISSSWELETATKEGYFYTKKLDKRLVAENKYYVMYSSKYDLLDNEKIANKELALALTNHKISDIFIDNILPNNLPKTYEKLITIPKTETLSVATASSRVTNEHGVILEPTIVGDRISGLNDYSLTLFSPHELNNDELNNIQVEIYPFNNPTISLSKNDYLPWTNPISTDKPTPYFLNTAYFFGAILVIYLLWDLIKRLLHFIWNLFSVFSKKTKIIFLLILAPSILFDIFMLPQVYDSITLWLTIFWIIVVTGYRLEGRFSYAAALSFLIICPISLIFKNEFIAEKAAIWTYMFLVVGTIQSLIELKVGSTDRVDLDKYWAKTESLRSRLFVILKETLIPIKDKMVSFFKYIVSLFQKKRTPKDYAIFFTKVIIIIILIMISMFLLKISYDKIQIEYKKYQRNQKNPVIQKIEPYYVYKGTKVLIKGKLFGLKNNDRQRLMSDIGELEYHFYDDSKIIFVMPTEWAFGEHSIWVEKNIGWDGKRVTAKSNIVKIKLLPITGGFTTDDKLYFDQLKNLDKETLEINGY
jgi:hypothetical protein